MKNVKVAFDFLNDGDTPPINFKRITCHLIFDMKFDLTRKARYVGGGHMTKVQTSMSYSTVVSRDTVKSMVLIAAIIGLDMKMCNIGNIYLNADTRERVWFIAGDEWNDRCVTKLIILRYFKSLI